MILVCLLLLLFASGCMTSSSPGGVIPTTAAEPRYETGDLLKGDLAGVGFDSMNITPAGAAIVVLEYQPQLGEYVYTLVRPSDRGWTYVYPADDWTAHLSRDRVTFEGYQLDLAGYVQVGKILPATPVPTPGSP